MRVAIARPASPMGRAGLSAPGKASFITLASAKAVICLSDVAERFHGFLRSVMLNPHPGVYIAMDLDAASRDRIWHILEVWWKSEPQGMGVLIIRNKDKVG